MEVGHATPSVLTLDLRSSQDVAWPKIGQSTSPDQATGVQFSTFISACALLVAVDGDAAYRTWQERFRPLYFSTLPYVVLLDPYTPEFARRMLLDGASDCCALDDAERVSSIVARLELDMERAPQRHIVRSDPTAWLQIILDAIPSPVFVKDRQYRYTLCNKAFAEYAGKPRQEIIGATVHDIWPADLAEVYEKADRDLMQQGDTQMYETNVRYADGTYHEVVFHKAIYSDMHGHTEGIAGTMLDITERKHLERQLEAAASTDFLTGIYNLRAFHELADQVFRDISRYSAEVALIAIDIDHFKAINDLHGHEAGDTALGLLVRTVKSSLRTQDIFARTGGDEFCILLPATTADAASAVAERIRVAVNHLNIESGNGITLLSISAGITVFQPQDRRLQDALRRADEALYEAKAAGRNRILLMNVPGQEVDDPDQGT